jgi:hypothetical protein
MDDSDMEKTYNEGVKEEIVSKEREPGFYWVKLYKVSKWTICKFDDDYWKYPGSDEIFEDTDFWFIDEKSISGLRYD